MKCSLRVFGKQPSLKEKAILRNLGQAMFVCRFRFLCGIASLRDLPWIVCHNHHEVGSNGFQI